jgi:glycosyltransferase involved in cell wall biosynthesis
MPSPAPDPVAPIRSSADLGQPESGGTTPRIVAFAFSCEPGGGSEGGAGWMWARVLAGVGETTLLVARGPHTELLLASVRALPAAEAARLHIEVIDPPRWVQRVVGWDPWPPLWYLEYAFWQARALRRARRLHRRQPFDLSWHLTWANAWFGSVAGLVGPAFVYGPVGAGVGTPWRLLSTVGLRGAVGEVVRAIARNGSRLLNPLSRTALRQASLILVQNPETRDWIPAAQRDRAVVFPHVVMPVASSPANDVDPRPRATRRTILFAGRLLPWKGGTIALRALRLLPDHRMVVIGSGPDERRMRSLAADLGVADRVDFRGWVERGDLLATMRDEASVFLFPSLHDEGGWVVAESIAAGLPVVCLDRGGPPILGGIGVPSGWPNQTARHLAKAVLAAEREPASTTVVPDLIEARRRVVRLLADRGILNVADRSA